MYIYMIYMYIYIYTDIEPPEAYSSNILTIQWLTKFRKSFNILDLHGSNGISRRKYVSSAFRFIVHTYSLYKTMRKYGEHIKHFYNFQYLESKILRF